MPDLDSYLASPVSATATRRYGLAVAAICLFALVQYLAMPYLQVRAPLGLLIIAVMISAVFGGGGPGLLASALGLVLGWFFFLPHTLSFVLESTQDVALLVAFSCICLSMCAMGELLWRARKRVALLIDVFEQSEQRLVALFEQATVGMSELDTRGCCVRVNDALCQMLGQCAADLTQRPWIDWIDPSDRIVARDALQRVLTSGEPLVIETRCTFADRGLGWISHGIARLLGPDGATRGLSVVSNDVTARREAEAGLRRSNANLVERVAQRTRERDRVWQVTRDLLVIVGADGRCQAVNPAWTQELGHAPDASVGSAFVDFLHPDEREDCARQLAQVLHDGHNVHFEARIATGARSYRCVDWSVVAADGRAYVSGRDVTEQHETAQQLRQAQKMEVVGQLTGGIAHDFNNMLAGIMSNLELLKLRIAQGRGADTSRYVDSALTVTQRAAALTHRLLAFSRRQTLKSVASDVNRLVVSMEDMLRRTLGPGIALHIALMSEDWRALCDPHLLESAVLNLAINSRDAMPDGGRLTIETAAVTLDARQAATRALSPGDYLAVCVSDTGAGMSAEVVSRALDPFFTTKPAGQGTGLGLSMIYGFVRQSQGQIRIASALGEGTTVSLLLPRFSGTESTGELSGSAAPQVPSLAARAATRILLVDDEAPFRANCAEFLAELGYEVMQAAHADEALQQLAHGAPVALLITDVGLPYGMDGRQLAQAVRARQADVKILYVTGFAEDSTVRSELVQGGAAVLAKPLRMSELSEAVAAQLTPANARLPGAPHA